MLHVSYYVHKLEDEASYADYFFNETLVGVNVLVFCCEVCLSIIFQVSYEFVKSLQKSSITTNFTTIAFLPLSGHKKDIY